MRNEFTAIIEQAEGWFIAYSPEMPGANGQGHMKEDYRDNSMPRSISEIESDFDALTTVDFDSANLTESEIARG